MKRTILRLMTACAVLATLCMPSAGAASECSSGAVMPIGRGWSMLSEPQWPTPSVPDPKPGDSNVGRKYAYAFAVDRTNADHLLYTNNHALMLSKDGGCTWENIFQLEQANADTNHPNVNGNISSPFIQGDTIYAQVGLPGRILFSHDLGKTIKTTSTDEPSGSWVVAPSDPKTIYVRVYRSGFVSGGKAGGVDYPSVGANLDSIHVSTDGGETWVEKSDLTARGADALQEVSKKTVVDARDPNVLYSFQGQGQHPTHRSTDGGETWAPLTNATTGGVIANLSLDTVDAGGVTSILAVPECRGNECGASDHFILRSDDGGEVFDRIPTTASPQSALFAGSPDKVIVYSHTQVEDPDGTGNINVYSLFRLGTRDRWSDISPPVGGDGIAWGPPFYFARLGTKPVLFAKVGQDILRFSGRL